MSSLFVRESKTVFDLCKGAQNLRLRAFIHCLYRLFCSLRAYTPLFGRSDICPCGHQLALKLCTPARSGQLDEMETLQ